MKVDFFVHGTPYGRKFWGKEEESSYCGSFYDGSTDRLKFVIQARNVNGKQYFYYNYLVYESIVDSDDRDGSYFGMTLRLDEFCVDFMNMYRVLDTAFNSYIVGKLLIRSGANLKYSVSSFSDFDVEGVWDKVLALLQGTLTNDSFAKVVAPSGDGQYRKLNLYDCTRESLLNEITQHGKIALSPYYPRRSESSIQQKCEDKIKAIQQQCQTQINEYKLSVTQTEKTAIAQIRSLQSQIAQLDSSIRGKDNEIGALNAKVSRLTNALEQEKQNKDISRLIEQIREPVKSLSNILDGRGRPNRTYGPDTRKPFGGEYPPREKPKSYRNILIIVMFLIIVVILACFLFCGNGMAGGIKRNDAEEQVDSVLYDDTAKDSTKIADNSGKQSLTPTDPDFDISKVTIDISGYSGKGELRIGQPYTVNAINGSEQGSWVVTGGTITKKDAKSAKIIPNDTIVIINYVVDGKSTSRELNAK